jgi:hypothetical protein
MLILSAGSLMARAEVFYMEQESFATSDPGKLLKGLLHRTTFSIARMRSPKSNQRLELEK